jgi:glutaminyl-peptide cyclotransferase
MFFSRSHLFGPLYLLACFALVNTFTPLSDSSLRLIPDASHSFDIKNGDILAPILIPRVSGTEGSTKVLNHMVNFFRKELPEWTLTFQNSTSKTPMTGNTDVPFINLIATRVPPWAKQGEVKYLTLAAHYDSKLTPHGFIGATDSAAPVAMLMQAAKNIDASLTQAWSKGQEESEKDNRGLQILMLDGEESFQSWTATDSLYGARSLAAEWETTMNPALSTFKTPLRSISLFLLLDLLGANNPRVPSYFQTTHWAYKAMAEVEARMRSMGLFKSKGNSKFLYDSKKTSEDRWLGGLIDDDHMPFLKRGVEVFHIIPSPFPRVWHEMDDNGENLDLPTMEDWTKLVTAFIAGWLDLEGSMVRPKNKVKAARSEL